MDPMTAVLLVADWNVDPREVIAAAGRRARRGECEFDLLVPAWLHGLAWRATPRGARGGSRGCRSSACRSRELRARPR